MEKINNIETKKQTLQEEYFPSFFNNLSSEFVDKLSENNRWKIDKPKSSIDELQKIYNKIFININSNKLPIRQESGRILLYLIRDLEEPKTSHFNQIDESILKNVSYSLNKLWNKDGKILSECYRIENDKKYKPDSDFLSMPLVSWGNLQIKSNHKIPTILHKKITEELLKNESMLQSGACAISVDEYLDKKFSFAMDYASSDKPHHKYMIESNQRTIQHENRHVITHEWYKSLDKTQEKEKFINDCVELLSKDKSWEIDSRYILFGWSPEALGLNKSPNINKINDLRNNLIAGKHDKNFPAQTYLEEIKNISAKDYQTIISKVLNEILSTYHEFGKKIPRYQKNLVSINELFSQTKASKDFISPF